jgi:hypothetical protein
LRTQGSAQCQCWLGTFVRFMPVNALNCPLCFWRHPSINQVELLCIPSREQFNEFNPAYRIHW